MYLDLFDRSIDDDSPYISISAIVIKHLITDRSFASTLTAASLCTVFIPLDTRPKMVCLPSRKGVGARVIKNWDPASDRVKNRQGRLR